MDEAPICALGGAMFKLPGKLDGLLRHGHMLPKGAEDEIPLIKGDLEEIISILQDHISRSEDPSVMVNCWMKEVRELSYDIEDCIDQYEHSADSKSKYICKIPRRKFTSRKTNRLSEKLKQRLWMANKIREFSARVREALQRHQMYNLGYIGRTTTTYDASLRALHHKLCWEAADPVGIDAPMNKLEEWLIKDGEQKLKVVSIVGVGGIGKTTLANKLYCKLGGQFDCRAFLRLSQKPEMRRLLISMLSQVRPHHPPDTWKVHNLIADIKTHLQDKRYLIVVDDVWATSTWDIVNRALPDDNRSSRILLTTEIEDVAHKCCRYDSKYVFMMKPLGGDDSRKLFFNTAFGPQHECPPELSEVSNNIIRKCGGSPLSTVTIASLLASQMGKPEQWDHVHRSLGYGLGTNTTLEGMKQVLNLSYNNLPHHLKACMLYLSIYEEDHIIWKGDLVKQWIAEGFICATEDQDKEEISGSYFDELVSRRMIQPIHISHNDEVLSCVVHHMVLNLITYKSIEENFVIAIDHSQTNARLADKVRRLSLHFSNAEDATPPTNMRLSQVRTLAFFGVFKCLPSILELRLLQVLILHLWGDEESISLDLTRISKLIRLKYLEVACNVTLELRTQMQGLQYLETLKIDARASAVPSDIVHLPGLLHLNLPAETNLPNGIVNITSLLTLGCFDISGNSIDNVRSLGELTNLRDLQLTCSTTTSGYLECTLECLGSILGKLSNLKSLTLVPSRSSYVNTVDAAAARSMSISCDGLSSVSSPPALLQRLDWLPRICIFASLPKWIGQLGKLCILKIGVRELARNDVDVLSGLPALTVLSLYVRTKHPEMIVFDKEGFSVLKFFKFRCSVPCLKFEADAMPNLRKLKLGFNALGADQHGTAAISIEHLSGLREISAKIGGAKADADSTLMTAISNHPSNPIINVQLVDCIFCGDESRSMGTKEKEHMTIEEQDETLEEDPDECYRTQGEDSGENENKQANSSGVGEQHGKLYRITSATEDPGASGSNSLAAQEQGPWTVEEDQMLSNYIAEHGKGSWNALARATELKEVVVSAAKGAMDPLLTKLATLMGDGYAESDGVQKQVMILKEELGAMNALLEKLADMAEQNMQMKDWRNQMREMTYDIEDCIDDLMLQFDKDNAKPYYIHQATAYPEKWDELQKFIHQIQDITVRVGKADLGSMVHKTEVQTLGSSYMATESRLSTIYDKAVALVGMDGPREELVWQIMGDEQQQKVVCILGPGGLGKTALAKEVYNRIKGQFGCRVFVPVYNKIGITRLLKNMLSLLNHREQLYWEPSYDLDMEDSDMEDVDMEDPDMEGANLINRIRRRLQDERYLIVFDGVWFAQTLEYILRALPTNKYNRGSMIIVTTRVEEIAKSCKNNFSHIIILMRPLPAQDSQILFRSIIFGSQRSCSVALKKIADKILEACGGVPLAIITIAGLLASKPAEVAQWEMVQKRMDPAGKGDLTIEAIKKILDICYSDLSRHMKSCLLYLSVFPENHVIRKDRLIWRWIAEGLIPRRGEESLWETGESYFQEFISRKLIEPAEDEWDEKPLGCKVHGLILEFITSLSNEENFVTTDAKATFMQHGVIRRLTVNYGNQEEDAFRPSTVDLPKLRSLTISGDVRQMGDDLLSRMHFRVGLRFLRVLDLEGAGNLTSHHLQGIEGLALLRYLGLGGTGIDKLSEEIGELQHLETLDLRRTTHLKILPASIVGLRKLVRLLLNGRVEPPEEIWKMQELEEVSTIDVGSSSSLNSVSELLIKSKRLRMLGVRWHIYSCDRRSVESFLNGVGKSSLQSLFVEGYPAGDLLGLLLDLWVPPHHLRRFKLTMFSDSRLKRVPPKMASLVYLTHLRIEICHGKAKDLRVLGDLPNLILLELRSLSRGRPIISSDGFRCLVVFSYTCPGRGVQFTPGAMPQLRRLWIEFYAKKTKSRYGGFDFGIQHLSCLTRVHATIRCWDATELAWEAAEAVIRERVLKSVDAAEAAIREQVSTNPNSPVLDVEQIWGHPKFTPRN